MKNATIVAPQPEAVEAGAEVLERGGNAIDAALACAFVQGVVDPQMAGIGGFGSMHVYMPRKGVHEVLEFYARAPLKATPDMWLDKIKHQSRDGFGYVLDGNISDIGYLAVCTPGSLKGYETALKDYGTFDWGDLIKPAVRLAREGFMIRNHMHWYWAKDQSADGFANTIDKLRFSDTGRRVYFHEDGSLKNVGELLFNKDMADTLERIARSGGSDIFYHGELAEEIAADFKSNGGLIDQEDLARYELSRMVPVWGEYRGNRIATSPPPGSGFPMLELLHIMEEFDVGSMQHSSAEHVRILFEAMKRMTIDKDAHMGDPTYVDVPYEKLLSREHAQAHALAIKAGEIASVDRLERSQRDTTHISVIDKDGNAAAMTHTLGSPSGAITAGLGFMYNGTMSRFNPVPGKPGSIAPGKRRPSSAAPTIVFKDGKPSIVIGAPGGSYIAPAVAQCLMNMIDFDMSVLEAVSAPRIVGVSNTIDICNRIRHSVESDLQAQGYKVARSPQTYAFAAVHAIKIEGGVSKGAADPQRDGMAISVA
ncbi:gamma-glutamyltransferase [Rhizobium sp. SEMIA 4085]|uniref:Glutathione hydrolase proenzyme n=1 Tax=Rhizobium gallicum bv. gallicum R602sp TaxID=1041138 RepID=A0A0B4XCE3_9HYPH|nr:MULTISPECIES: gamma-glutamyltransferase [Rhizobium]AJD44430.1 gamma-glutamyltranspeptidase 2 [Rhizobium gallicum bv. gallicum R602sp]NNH32782.1 gamma-glutamyltransferase [Rhizobium sp. SEMIA 4085]